MRKHRVDFLPLGLEERLHQLLAARGRPVAVLGLDDLHPRMGRDSLLETLLPIDGGSGAGAALQFDDVGLAVSRLGEPLGRLLALVDEVGGEQGHVERRVAGLDAAVHQDDGDLGGLGLLENRIPARLDPRGKDDGVDALGDERAKGLDLVGLAVLRVHILQVDVVVGGLALERVGLGGAPRLVFVDLGETHRQLLARVHLLRGSR